ncbi:hypothetical protein MAM1_0007d00899 [Mucor ambiguus]|uniref:Uncharacterized protein n=1 Tax=Mucor ambiguus TaxID=91626 RepID=A0A0C9M0C2_9FUNG|nr:hypothetical protein MAM1_0007d00899 [Mucor ambiguus]
MYSKLALIFLILALFQGTQSFCIYNQFTDGSTFDIVQRNHRTLYTKVFKKHMSPEAKECCPYTTFDCNPRPVNDDFVQFTLYFQWPRFNSRSHVVQCVSGGALTFYGNEDNHWAECTNAYGVSERAVIEPFIE